MRSNFIVLLALIAVPLIVVPLNAGTAEPGCDRWLCNVDKDNQLVIAPYLWLPGIKGEAELAGTQAAFDYSAEQLIGGLNAGAMGYLQWHHGEDFFYLDGLGFEYEDRVEAVQNKLLNARVGMVELGYGRHYCLGPAPNCKIQLSPYIGLRRTILDITVQLNEGGVEALLLLAMGIPDQITATERWLDPAVGLVTEISLSDNWQIITKVDAAGLGIGYNQYWNGIAVLHYRLSDRWTVAAGYRESDFDAEPGGRNEVELKLRGKGPLAGISYTF